MKNIYRDMSLQASERSSPAANQSASPGVKRRGRILPGFVLAMALMAPCGAVRAAGPAPIDLKSCTNFTLLAYSTITCTGAGTINGDVGLSPAGTIDLGTPPTTVNGSIYNGGPIAAQAQSDLNDAFIAASPGALPGGINVGAELGGLVLVPGVYQSPSGSYDITLVDLTLDGGPNDVWVFQMASTLTVGTGRQVILTGGAQARNIFWQVGSSASLLASTIFKGNIMADASISMLASSSLDGRALARTGAVTFNGSSGSLPGPAKAINPMPTNGATSQAISTNVSWSDGGGSISYDVYFGTTNNPGAPELQGNQTNLIFDPGVLDYDTTYYWRIDAKNTASTTEGDIWSFTTEPQSPGFVQLTSSNYSVHENGGSVTVTVTRTSGSAGVASVNYATVDGSAIAGLDYTAVSGTLNWGNLDADTKFFTIPILDNHIAGWNRTFTVTLANAGGSSLGSPALATVSILENDTNVPPRQLVYLDFDGDSKADITVYWPERGLWYILQSATGVGRFQAWGWPGAVPVPGDYDGDLINDVAVYAPETGSWFIWLSASQSPRTYTWGWSEAQPVQGDYDGDGLCDVAVYWPEQGLWYILQSDTGAGRTQAWGWPDAVPVPGDYDGDGQCDVAVYHAPGGGWSIWQSSTQTARVQAWGWDSAEAAPGDFDGDRTMDVAVYCPESGFWNAWLSSNLTMYSLPWGWNEAWPVQADYDGDGRYDRTVYAPHRGEWYLWQSGSGTLRTQQWGWDQAVPVNL